MPKGEVTQMKRIVVLAVCCVVLSLLSCGKKEVKKETLEGRIASEAIAVIDKLKGAYIKRNRSEIEQTTTPQSARAILQSLAKFDSVELSFNPVWMEIEQDKVTVNVSWKAKWTVSGNTVEDRGMAIFELRGQPMKVDRILRANPFNVPL